MLFRSPDGDAAQFHEQLYCARGEAENRIKQAQLGLFADRTSCHYFAANQFRLLLSSLAYVLASPFIPFVLFRRVAPNAVAALRARRLPLTTLPMMFLGSFAHGFCELFGYAGVGPFDRAEIQMAEFEIHKTRYASRVAS